MEKIKKNFGTGYLSFVVVSIALMLYCDAEAIQYITPPKARKECLKFHVPEIQFA